MYVIIGIDYVYLTKCKTCLHRLLFRN